MSVCSDLRQQGAVHGQEDLPLVIPLVLYNGDARWSVPLNVAGAIGDLPSALERFRPSVPYLMLDETRIALGEDAPLQNLAAAIFRLEQPPDPTNFLMFGQQLRRFLIERGLGDCYKIYRCGFVAMLVLAWHLDPFTTGDTMLAGTYSKLDRPDRAEGRQGRVRTPLADTKWPDFNWCIIGRCSP